MLEPPLYPQDAHEVFHSTGIFPQYDGRVVIRRFPLWLGVYSSKIQLLPHLLKQLIDVPAVLGANRTCIRYPINQVELFDGDRIDLIQSIYHRDIAPTLGLQDIDEIINGRITTNCDVSRRYFVLAHYSFDLLQDISSTDVDGAA